MKVCSTRRSGRKAFRGSISAKEDKEMTGGMAWLAEVKSRLGSEVGEQNEDKKKTSNDQVTARKKRKNT